MRGGFVEEMELLEEVNSTLCNFGRNWILRMFEMHSLKSKVTTFRDQLVTNISCFVYTGKFGGNFHGQFLNV